MKIKQEIEWVVGELPATESLKLIAVEVGGTTIASIGYYDKKLATWFRDNEQAVYSRVIAWASVPLFQGVPAECDSAGHLDSVIERLIEAVGILGKESERRLWTEFEDPDHKYGSELDKLKHLDVYVRTGKVEA